MRSSGGWLLASAWAWAAAALAGPAPDQGDFAASAGRRWLDKRVLAGRALDDMASTEHWAAFTTGLPQVVDARATQSTAERAQAAATMSVTHERTRAGHASLRMRLPSRLEGPGPGNGRGWGSAGVRRSFPGEDWSAYNRVSLWIRPDCPGVNVPALELRLYNEGAQKLPAVFGQEGETTVVLRNQEWNHVVWEIGNVARDRVTAFEVSSLMPGHEPEAGDTLSYDLDSLELQRVEPDYIEGWGVWPGRIAYSHAGYPVGAAKSAVASGLAAKEFQVIDQATGRRVLSKPLPTVTTPLGAFQVMDFSEVRRPGSYILEAGEVRTHPFPVDADVWRDTILKALNFLYGERCGMAIPGVHGICHRDWTATHGDQRIVINGGWHDAGDLTQGLGNTGEIVYALFSLAERLHARGEDPELYARVLDEARWGLDWVLKTRFGDGYRDQGAISSRWTDGIVGTSDDLTVTARNSALGNFTAAAAEAIAARVLKESDPREAAYCLRIAEEDWRFARAVMTQTNTTTERWRGTFDSDGVEHETASVGVLASVDLWQATGARAYTDAAVEIAGVILASQERRRPAWDVPLLGFFYTGPAKDRLLHYCHRGREQGPILALTRLCAALPEHRDWMKWYSAVALYADYLKAAARYNQPYDVLPGSIYRTDEAQTAPVSRRDSFAEQVLKGVPLGQGNYLRRFPVWLDYRGHFGVILPQAQALMAAAHLRGDLDAVTLARRQAEWILGRNPFAESTMYGAGHDYAPLYAPFPGDLAGALPVGIQTRGAEDAPYWPVQATWTYKEVWVHPVGRWLWLMRDLAGPALVEGQADGPVELVPAGVAGAAPLRATPVNGRFRILAPEGRYTVRCGREEAQRTFLPAGRYELDLGAHRSLDYEVARVRRDDGTVQVRLTARGEGAHRFRVRTENLNLAEDEAKEMILKRGAPGVAEWRGTIQAADTPWFVVVTADGNPAERRELTGAAWEP